MVTPSLFTTAVPRLEIRPGVWLDGRRALYFSAIGVLAVADLHWGYAESHRVHGNLLPAWGDAEIARTLDALVADYRPRELLWLGDSLHTLAGRTAAENYLRRASTTVAIVSGNHDAKWPRAADRPFLARDGFLFHHGDRAPACPPDVVEVVGHHHPAFVWSDGAGARLKLPALVVSSRRLVLPAFSPWAAGTPWLPAGDEKVYAIGAKRIFTAPAAVPQKGSPTE
ncbi:MAG TPA: metallophosphoesterase [Opitutus sp.]|nr:metallophosphoesterase [Opitutus sp.]